MGEGRGAPTFHEETRVGVGLRYIAELRMLLDEAEGRSIIAIIGGVSLLMALAAAADVGGADQGGDLGDGEGGNVSAEDPRLRRPRFNGRYCSGAPMIATRGECGAQFGNEQTPADPAVEVGGSPCGRP